MFLDRVYDRICIDIHQSRHGQLHRSHESFSSRRNSSYSSHVSKARGPGGRVFKKSIMDMRAGGAASFGKTTITSTLVPSSNSGALTSTRWPGNTVVSIRNGVWMG